MIFLGLLLFPLFPDLFNIQSKLLKNKPKIPPLRSSSESSSFIIREELTSSLGFRCFLLASFLLFSQALKLCSASSFKKSKFAKRVQCQSERLTCFSSCSTCLSSCSAIFFLCCASLRCRPSFFCSFVKPYGDLYSGIGSWRFQKNIKDNKQKVFYLRFNGAFFL